MTFSEYQIAARKTAMYPRMGYNLLYPVLGLVGEAGEVAEKIKKHWRNDGGDAFGWPKPLKISVSTDHEKMAAISEEVGDILWYCAALCSELGIDLEDVASSNIRKLASRADRGVIKSEGDNR